MKKHIYIAISLSLLFLINCAGSSMLLKYGVDLKTVERPKDPKVPYGEISTKMVEKTENGKTKILHEFEDEMISGFFYFTNESVAFQLKNKTNYTMKILWDNCAFIGSDGETKRVVHEGIKLIDRNSPQPPSVIIRNGKITDSLTPSDHIYYVSGQYGGWRYLNLFHNYSYTTTDMNVELEKAKKGFLDKQFSILLSFEIEGTTNDYIFNFNVNDIQLISRY